MLIDELIEKAFSDGYEYAQREFTSIRKLKKTAKNLWSGNSVQYLQDSGLISKKEAMGTNPMRSLKRTIKGGTHNTESFLDKNASKLPQKYVNKVKGGLGKHVNRLNKAVGTDLWEIY